MTPAPTFDIDAINGVPFRVRLVRKGDHYGANMCLTHTAEAPTVEFYDYRYQHSYDFVGTKTEAIAAGAQVLGQFTGGSYRLSTLRESRGAGLNLNGGVVQWQVDADSMTRVHAWLDSVVPPGERFSHAYDFGFEVVSYAEDASDVTADQLRAAIIERVQRLDAADLVAACGRFDTHDIDPVDRSISTPDQSPP